MSRRKGEEEAPTGLSAKTRASTGKNKADAGKRPAIAGKRPAAATSTRRAAQPRKAAPGKPRKTASKRGKAATRGATRGATPVPPRVMRIRELIPQVMCGKGTSVQHLFRVEDVSNGAAQIHLVFFDRHGWYCEHGPTCHAVGEVRRLAAQM